MEATPESSSTLGAEPPTTSRPTKRPRLRGVLRGLDPNAILRTPSTQQPVEISDDDNDNCSAPIAKAGAMSGNDAMSKTKSDFKPKSDRATRGALYGRAPALYDQKYHPMDEVTRPKRAARRRFGSLPASVNFDDQSETSEESLPTDASKGDGSSDEQNSEEEVSLPVRVPDPKASRHSQRAEAQKVVSYSRKSHPQDYALPGFQHRALRSRVQTSFGSTSNKRRSEQIIIDSDDGPEDLDHADTMLRDDSSSKTKASRKRSASAALLDCEGTDAVHGSQATTQPSGSRVATDPNVLPDAVSCRSQRPAENSTPQHGPLVAGIEQYIGTDEVEGLDEVLDSLAGAAGVGDHGLAGGSSFEDEMAVTEASVDRRDKPEDQAAASKPSAAPKTPMTSIAHYSATDDDDDLDDLSSESRTLVGYKIRASQTMRS